MTEIRDSNRGLLNDLLALLQMLVKCLIPWRISSDDLRSYVRGKEIRLLVWIMVLDYGLLAFKSILMLFFYPYSGAASQISIVIQGRLQFVLFFLLQPLLFLLFGVLFAFSSDIIARYDKKEKGFFVVLLWSLCAIFALEIIDLLLTMTGLPKFSFFSCYAIIVVLIILKKVYRISWLKTIGIFTIGAIIALIPIGIIFGSLMKYYFLK